MQSSVESAPLCHLYAPSGRPAVYCRTQGRHGKQGFANRKLFAHPRRQRRHPETGRQASLDGRSASWQSGMGKSECKRFCSDMKLKIPGRRVLHPYRLTRTKAGFWKARRLGLDMGKLTLQPAATGKSSGQPCLSQFQLVRLLDPVFAGSQNRVHSCPDFGYPYAIET